MSMRKRISLYIASQLVDLDDQSFILYNYTMEDLQNPTIIRNSYTQQITLKGSATNNRIFGDAFRLDRDTMYGSKYLGAYFDMARRTPFTLYNEMNEILESGYVKLDNVVRDGVSVEYKITLYGGLGGFFYGLQNKEDGSKRTLADMRYQDHAGSFTRYPGSFSTAGGYAMLKDAWEYLADPDNYNMGSHSNWWPNIINFAPAYNGIPEKFSADKAVVTPGYYANIPNVGFKNGTFSNLMLLGNQHDEWELKEMRWYLQRPVFRMKSIIDAICDKENNGGYDVTLSSAFFNESNKVYWDTWLTLPMIDVEKRNDRDVLLKMLSGTQSPADYLISFAKMCGLVFLYDASARSVRIMHRSEFYAGDMVDMTKRINKKDLHISPVLAQSRYFQFGNDAVGEWARQYKEDHGKGYGVQIVNTGYEFNDETKIVTNGILFKNAAEVQQRNLLYRSQALTTDSQGRYIEHLVLPRYESVKIQGWNVVEGKEEMTEHDVFCRNEDYVYPDNPFFPNSDWLPKMQFHDGNKTIDAVDVLVYFNGIKECTYANAGRYTNVYRLTDDTSDMMTLNENQPCWNMTDENSMMLTALPSFRRSITKAASGYNELQLAEILESLDWGDPVERALVGVQYDSATLPTIYGRWWRNYQKDRFDDDTFIMTTKVDLRGLQVGQELMRRFFYYDGAVFVLNKIINHSLTTWDDTECEFIKVQDKMNYTK
jgi:hypothetical protein